MMNFWLRLGLKILSFYIFLFSFVCVLTDVVFGYELVKSLVYWSLHRNNIAFYQN